MSRQSENTLTVLISGQVLLLIQREERRCYTFSDPGDRGKRASPRGQILTQHTVRSPSSSPLFHLRFYHAPSSPSFLPPPPMGLFFFCGVDSREDRERGQTTPLPVSAAEAIHPALFVKGRFAGNQSVGPWSHFLNTITLCSQCLTPNDKLKQKSFFYYRLN